MAEIQNPDYETVTAKCEHCGSVCIFNRIDDIGEPRPYAGRHVTCSVCQKEFWIYNDIINPAYELFIFDAREHLRTKRYMRCIASLAQGWEIFFSTFAYSNYLYQPFFSDPSFDEDIEHFNQLSSQLNDAIRKFTFNPLRNVLINTIFNDVHPLTLAGSEVAIRRIKADNFGANLVKAKLSTFPDPQMRDILGRLQTLQVGELRNKVVHQHAYRPRRAEVEKCHEEEVRFLYRVRLALRVGTFEEWQFGAVPGPTGNEKQ